MRAESKTAPVSIKVEPRGDVADVIVTENAVLVDRGGEGIYQYDEYRVAVPMSTNLEDRARANPAAWLAYAKGEISLKETASTNAANICDKLKAAIADNKAYIAIDTPTAAQNTAQIKRLTRQNIRLIREILGMFDAAE